MGDLRRVWLNIPNLKKIQIGPKLWEELGNRQTESKNANANSLAAVTRSRSPDIVSMPVH